MEPENCIALIAVIAFVVALVVLSNQSKGRQTRRENDRQVAAAASERELQDARRGNVDAIHAVGAKNRQEAIPDLVRLLDGSDLQAGDAAARTLETMAWIPANSKQAVGFYFHLNQGDKLFFQGEAAVKYLINKLENKQKEERVRSAGILASWAKRSDLPPQHRKEILACKSAITMKHTDNDIPHADTGRKDHQDQTKYAPSDCYSEHTDFAADHTDKGGHTDKGIGVEWPL